MAHQLVLVLVADPHTNVVGQVDALMEPHSVHAKVPPYKEHFEPCHWMGRGWDEGDAEEFARRRAEMFGEQWGRDEAGYFRWLDGNPDGRYDYKTIGGGWDGLFAGRLPGVGTEADDDGGRVEGNVCPVADLPPDLHPGSIVTPDGAWHFFGWRFSGEPPDEQGIASIQEIRRRYAGYYAVAVDAHS